MSQWLLAPGRDGRRVSIQLESGRTTASRGVHRRHCLAHESGAGCFPARRKLLRPCPGSRPQHPRPSGLQSNRTPLGNLKHPGGAVRDRPWAVCPRLTRNAQGPGQPKPARAPRSSPAPSTGDAHVPPPSPRLSHQGTYSLRGSLSPILGAASGTDSPSSLAGSGGRPQRHCAAGLRAPSRGGREAPGLPFNGNNALSASPQWGVSLGQRVRVGGTPGGERAESGGWGPATVIGLRRAWGGSQSLQNRWRLLLGTRRQRSSLPSASQHSAEFMEPER